MTIFGRTAAARLIACATLVTLPAAHSSDSSESEYVKVNAVNNPRDTVSNCGDVSYEYEIQKFEVTNSTYARFLNAVATLNDENQLYSPLMAEHFFGGIEKTIDTNGHAEYKAKPGYERLPATFVSWNSAARFANWMHYEQQKPQPGKAMPTEGSTTDGAYDTSSFGKSSSIVRNKKARYWIPNCSEWVKAGFYDPHNQIYLDYASIDGREPRASRPDKNISGPTATYFLENWAAPFPHLTPVGLHSETVSPFGTFDQMGNGIEWLEDNADDNSKMLRGGSVFMGARSMRRAYHDQERPEKQLSTVGFRLARTPDRISAPPLPPAPKDDSLSSDAPQLARAIQLGRSSLEFILADEPHNAADPYSKKGSVAYRFLISKHEITNAQYAEFLNATSKLVDKHCLYSQSMEDGVAGGISRSQTGDQFSYTAKPGWEDRPVTYVSWYDAARFINWLENSRSKKRSALTHAETEGTVETGSYDTTYFDDGCGPDSGTWAKQPPVANKSALFKLPSEAEWYKAAYYDPTRYGSRKYWNFPVRSDDPPSSKSDARRPSANYQVGTSLGEGAPYYVSKVGAYGATSYFGTADQGGNVWEWLEDWRSKGSGNCWRCDEWTRGLKGGSFNYTYIGLHAENTDPGAPSEGYPFYGLRVVMAVDDNGFIPSPRSTVDRFKSLAKEARDDLLAFNPISFVLGLVGAAFFGLAATALLIRSRRPDVL